MKTSKVFLPLIALFFFICTVSSFAQSTVSFGFVSNIDRCSWGCPNDYTINFYGQFGELVHSVTISASKDQEVFFNAPTGYYERVEVESSAINWLDPDGIYTRLEFDMWGLEASCQSFQNENVINGSTMRAQDVYIADTDTPYIYLNNFMRNGHYTW